MIATSYTWLLSTYVASETEEINFILTNLT